MCRITRPIISLRKSNKGNMPFAIIAVTLLILGSAYGIVTSQLEKNGENTENIAIELDAIGTAIESTDNFIKKGLGEIIFDISTKSTEGTLEQRAETFQKRASEWMYFQFPCMDSGVTVTLIDFDTKLAIESLKLTTSDEFTEGYTPSYLIGTGSFTAKYVCDSGSSVKTTTIETDGSCALPLVAEQGSLFKNAITGSGSILAQMMTYQLTALAQYRVLNGYGSLSEYGEMGTVSILTKDDVEQSYRSALSMLELLNFRIYSNGLSPDSKYIDLADYFVADNGYINIDISAIYSQALISVLDDLCLKWFDYFYGNKILNLVDKISDSLNNAWDSIKGFFSHKNEFSAAPYIDKLMSSNGYSVSDYRYLLSGRNFTLNIPESVITATVSEKTQELTISNICASVAYPNVDLMCYKGISNFKSDYRADTNEIREWFQSIINTAAINLGQAGTFGTIRFKVNPSDPEAFLETVSKTVTSSLKNSDIEFEKIIENAIGSQNIIDPFYASIYKVINNNAETIYGLSIFENNIRTTLTTSVINELDKTYGTILDPTVVSSIVDEMMTSDQVSNAIENYRMAISKCVATFDSMNKVPGGQSGLIKDICIGTLQYGLTDADKYGGIIDRICGLCKEVCENVKVNSYYGLTDLPGYDYFEFTDKDGNNSTEKLSMNRTSNPSITVDGPNSNLSECMHYVGFNEDTGASFCTVFTVDVKDTLKYSVFSAGTLESIMGISDSSIDDSADINIQLKIAVASGWGLSGVKDYKASNTIGGDVWNALIDLLSPLLEPLRKIVSMIMDAMSIFSSALMEVAKYASAVVERLYNALMEPLEQLKDLIESTIDALISPILESAVDAVQYIVGIDASKQTVGFSFMGFFLTFTTKLATLVNNTKTLLIITLGCDFDNLDISGSITIKQKGSGSTKETFVTGSASISGNGWKVDADIDPMMKSSKHLITMSGVVKGVQFDIILPELVQYNEIDFCLSDAPGLSAVLSNIPLPFPGMKASLDAGIDLKFNIPFEHGLLINEFESNPSGSDAGNEWAELYNASTSSVDLEGYTLSAGSNIKTKVYTITDTVLKPGERVIVVFPGTFLNNSSSSSLKGGDYLVLRNTDGEQVDKTPTKSDSANDSYTWQRVADGASDWTFSEGSQDSPNGGGVLSGNMMKTQIIKVLKDSAVKTMGDMKNLTSTEDLSAFFQVAMQRAITSGIEMLSDCLVEASVFVSLDITDASSTSCVGFRAAIVIDSDFAEDGLKCLIGEIESLLFNMENPYGIQPKTVITDDIYLGITVYTGLTAPKILKDLKSYPHVKLGVQIKANISALCKLIGQDTGTWTVTGGVLIMNCPYEVIPSALKADKTLDSDLWLIKATFKEVNS